MAAKAQAAVNEHWGGSGSLSTCYARLGHEVPHPHLGIVAAADQQQLLGVEQRAEHHAAARSAQEAKPQKHVGKGSRRDGAQWMEEFSNVESGWVRKVSASV